jgi:competence protein ComEA
VEENLSQQSWQVLLWKFRWPLTVLILGLAALGGGILITQKTSLSGEEVVILENARENSSGEIVVEISGAVEKPGVYKLTFGSRVEDLLIAAGGVTARVDRTWLEKNLNRAGKLTDGQKIFLPNIGQQSSSSTAKVLGGEVSGSNNINGTLENLININTAGASELDTLDEIGRERAQNIIEGRPYSSVEELVSRKIISLSVFEKIKNKISVY